MVSGAHDGEKGLGIACFQKLVEQLPSLCRRNYAVSVLVGSVDATAQAVELSAASPPIRVILKLGVTIRGTVEDGAGSTVLLWP